MSLVVTGATGHLGRLVVEDLLDAGVPADQIVAGGRNLAAVQDLADRGVDVRRIDYSDPASLEAGLAGAEKVLVVSGTDFGQRVAQHTAVAEAALAAGARQLVYTSAPYATTTSMLLAAEHAGTEEALTALGAPLTILRNSWYFENYTDQLPVYLEHGAVVGAAGDGRVSGAPRADYAAAAAAVLTGDGHEGAVYELGGDSAFTLAELAAVVSEVTGREIGYHQVTAPELTAILVGAGVPAPVAEVLVDVERAIDAGELLVETGDLSRLIGRPTGTLRAAIEAAVAELPVA
jgi:NAD(P)H dehydrogenase (quinone)